MILKFFEFLILYSVEKETKFSESLFRPNRRTYTPRPSLHCQGAFEAFNGGNLPCFLWIGSFFMLQVNIKGIMFLRWLNLYRVLISREKEWNPTWARIFFANIQISPQWIPVKRECLMKNSQWPIQRKDHLGSFKNVNYWLDYFIKMPYFPHYHF